MTVVVTICCTDGVVVATDSMITNSLGGIGTAETKGKKLYALPDNHLHAFAGDPALAYRFRAVLEHSFMATLPNQVHALDYATAMTTGVINHFSATKLSFPVNLSCSLSFVHNNTHQCVFYDGSMQPKFSDADHYWWVFGSGKQYADPFLAFLTDVFSPKQPTTKEGKFLATWALDHVIQTNTGGVNGPIQMAVLQRLEDETYRIEEQSDEDIDSQMRAIDGAKSALVNWRNLISGKTEDENAAVLPTVQSPK